MIDVFTTDSAILFTSHICYMEYQKELDELFQRHGIDNYPDFAKSACHCNGWDGGPKISDKAIILNDYYSDPHDIGYIYVVDKPNHSNQWALIAVEASYQMDTIRKIERVWVVSKSYRDSIPNKEIIQKEMLEKMAKEETNERAYVLQQRVANLKIKPPFRKR